MLKRIVSIVTVLLRPSFTNFCPREGLSSFSSMAVSGVSDLAFEHLENVRGRSDEHLNSVLFSRVPQATGTVVYFGGDGKQAALDYQKL